MTAQYLDKEKVLKAMSECDGNPPLTMETRIKEGKFDAPMEPIGSRILYLTQIKKLLESVNEKDVEIARLKEEIARVNNTWYAEEDYQKIGNAIWDAFGFKKDPGTAKDIGDLTLRVDNLEKGVEISHDRCLRLETAFKSLKENGISITAENGTIYSLKVKREL
jgi:hypothetical protein